MSGHVVDVNGNRVDGATVTVFQAAPVRIVNADAFMQGLQGGASVVTDVTGAYLIDGIPPTTKMSGQARPSPNRIGASHPDRGVAPPRDLGDQDATVDLVLNATGAIDGKLVGAASDHEYVWAALSNHAGEPTSTKIEADRSFHFDKLASGDYSIWIARQNSDGYALPPTHVTVVAGKRVGATIGVPDTVTLRVHVIDGKCQVALLLKPGPDTPSSNGELGHSICDGDHVDIVNVPPGSYRVCIDLTHCVSVTATPTPSTQQVDLHAKP